MVTAKLDKYKHAVYYDKEGEPIYIDFYLDAFVDISGISTEVTGKKELLKVSGKVYKRISEEAFNEDNILRIYVEAL